MREVGIQCICWISGSVVIRGRSDSCDRSTWEPDRGTESGGVDCVTSSTYSEAEVFISFHFPAHVTG